MHRSLIPGNIFPADFREVACGLLVPGYLGRGHPIRFVNFWFLLPHFIWATKKHEKTQKDLLTFRALLFVAGLTFLIIREITVVATFARAWISVICRWQLQQNRTLIFRSMLHQFSICLGLRNPWILTDRRTLAEPDWTLRPCHPAVETYARGMSGARLGRSRLEPAYGVHHGAFAEKG